MTLDYLDRVIVGCWQLAEGHSTANTAADTAATHVIERYHRAGFRTFDCADIYTGVERALGDFIRAHGLAAGEVRVHTKYVPDLAALPTLGRDAIERTIDRSRARLGVERLDLVQFHWWDLSVPGWLEALETLTDLRREGRIAEIGLTNFDAARLQEILDHGVPVASIQTQVSLLDRRPRARLAPLARERGVALLGYGSVAGGFLSDRWLGAPAPREPLENRSLAKYRLIVEEAGGWDALQALLGVLREVADARGSDVATVASAFVLQREGVRACIVGVRNTRHLEAHAALRDEPPLAPAELERIEAARAAFREVPGAVYELERDRDGPHGRIMKYDLNRAPA